MARTWLLSLSLLVACGGSSPPGPAPPASTDEPADRADPADPSPERASGDPALAVRACTALTVRLKDSRGRLLIQRQVGSSGMDDAFESGAVLAVATSSVSELATGARDAGAPSVAEALERARAEIAVDGVDDEETRLARIARAETALTEACDGLIEHARGRADASRVDCVAAAHRSALAFTELGLAFYRLSAARFPEIDAEAEAFESVEMHVNSAGMALADLDGEMFEQTLTLARTLVGRAVEDSEAILEVATGDVSGLARAVNRAKRARTLRQLLAARTALLEALDTRVLMAEPIEPTETDEGVATQVAETAFEDPTRMLDIYELMGEHPDMPEYGAADASMEAVRATCGDYRDHLE